jgi:hypothetical protein
MTATKVVRFLTGEPEAIRSRWRELLSDARRPDGGPTRVTLATAFALPDLPAPPFAAVDVQWFLDEAAAQDHDAWLRGRAPALALGDGSCGVVVEESVRRGADLLAHRWERGGERFKMMSFGRRNPALSRPEFAERWRREAGRLGTDVIPDDVRGVAYVQDHPVGDDAAFDAVNEVWFERLDDLRRRAEWFAARPVPADLMSPSACWSLYLREEVLA